MGNALVIVESPAKAKTISKFLGKNYTVLASMGHIRDLPEKKFGVNIEKDFTPEYELSSKRKKIIDDLKKAASSAETIFLAPDPDREGEAIAWHLQETLKKSTKAKFFRVTFHEITNNAINKAFEHAGVIDQDRVDAQQARRVLDRIVGWQVSDFLRRRIFGATSAGRVQTVALRLICDREKEIQSFVSVEYWSLKVKLAKQNGIEFISTLAKLDDKKPEISSGELANKLKNELEKASFTVVDIASKDRKQNPSPPFITSTLQQAASSSLRMSPSQTMKIAQDLYEGVDVGSGTTGLITYMRTDSVNVAQEAQKAALYFIEQEYGKEYLPPKPNFYKTKSSAQAAHEAIRPTDVSRTPQSLQKYLDRDQLRLYTLIWNKFMASQMASALFKQETVEIVASGSSCSHSYLFRTTASRNIFLGYLKVYDLKNEGEEEEDDLENSIPPLQKNEKCNPKEFLTKQHFTEPLPRFSEATLVKELDANGVGRPSTYAATVKTIQDREYVTKDKGKLIPTSIGMDTCGYLCETIPTLFEIKFTASMEDQLDEVESGKIRWTKMLRGFYDNFTNWIQIAKSAGVPPKENFKTLLNLFHSSVKYDAPEKVGTKTYSDEKFIHSLKTDFEKNKEFSAKQWESLVRLVAKYKEQLSGVNEVAEQLGIVELVAAKLKSVQDKLAAAANPDTESLKLLAHFDKVKFDESRKVGNKVYDDGKFIGSLREQATAGKNLSENQKSAMLKLLNKYNKQIEGFDDVAQNLGLPSTQENATQNQEIAKLLALFDGIKNWQEPTKKGRFTYDDKAFAESLKKQFADKGQLSEKQLAAAQRTLAKYQEQLPESMQNSQTMPVKPKAEDTGVKCPTCQQNNLLKRSSRGRTFYGCSGFPKCKFIVNDLSKVTSV